MKKTASIFFLGILLFNWFGYRLLSSFLEEKATSALIVSLDKDQYNEDDLITIKLPSNLPYYTNSTYFNRIDGEIELNGTHYNFVKTRMYKDSIEYRCIPNKDRTRLSNARDEFYKLVNDLQHPSQNKKADNTGGIKRLLSEYCQENNSWDFSFYSPDKLETISFYIFFLATPSVLPGELPPDEC